MPLVYEDFRRLANHYMRCINLRLCHQEDPHWGGRAHFFAVAAKMMRRILVDHARRRSAGKRGGGIEPDDLDEALVLPVPPTLDVVSLDEPLKKLAEFDERKSYPPRTSL